MENKKVNFYICNTCGNLVTCLNEGGGTLVCCGSPMDKIEPNTVDASREKHVPYVKDYGSRIVVTVGTDKHPSIEEHHIKWIALLTNRSLHIKWLLPGEEPMAVFKVTDQEAATAAYAYCNLHGLWKKDL